MLTQQERERYSRQMVIPGFGTDAHELLKNSSVLVVGAGGLGCPALLNLVASGLGKICIADYDTVQLSNLQRQYLYQERDIGRAKALIAAERLQALNSDVQLRALNIQVSKENINDLFMGIDLILDCTDRFDTRYLLSDVAKEMEKALIYAAVFRGEGQIAVFDHRKGQPNSASYRDLYPESTMDVYSGDCSSSGVLSTTTSILGSLQALEAIKILTKMKGRLNQELLIVNSIDHTYKKIQLPKSVKKEKKMESPTNTISAQNFMLELKNAAEQIVVLALQESLELEMGTEHVFATVDEILNFAPTLSADNKIVLACPNGIQSHYVATLLKETGLTNQMVVLEGGKKAWRAMPVS